MQGPKFDTELCKQFIEKEFMGSALPSIMEYVTIENISKVFHTPEEWQTIGWNKLLEAAEHIKKWIDNSGVKGIKTQIISNKQENLTPIIFAEVQGQIDETYFFYGHYDKQPPFLGWNEGLGPYTPVLTPNKENPEKLYGRGGADDGYAAYSTILTIRALQEQGIPTPRCVIIIEGDEQSSTGDVEKHVENLKARIGDPKLIFCLDSGTLDYDRLWTTTSLRGALKVSIRVDILSEGVHSGSSSGYVPNSFRILRQLIQRLENQDTGVMVKDLEVDIPPNRYKELYELASQLGQKAVKTFPTIEGLQRVSPNIMETLILGGWKPQLVLTGVQGLPVLAKAGNVMLPFTSATLSIRLPPTKKGEEAKKFVVKTLTENPPYNCKVTVLGAGSGDGFNAPEMPEPLQNAIQEASQIYYGNKALTIAEGMSIPFLGFLNELWPKAKFMVTGVLGPASNAHGPNEFLHVPYVKKLTCSMAYVLAKTAGKL